MSPLALAFLLLITTSPVTPCRRLDTRSPHTHRLAAAIDRCESLDLVLAIFKEQSWAFDEFRNGDPKLVRWLISVVNGGCIPSRPTQPSAPAPVL